MNTSLRSSSREIMRETVKVLEERLKDLSKQEKDLTPYISQKKIV